MKREIFTQVNERLKCKLVTVDLQGGAGIKGFIDYAPCVATAAGGARLDIEHGCAASRFTPQSHKL